MNLKLMNTKVAAFLLAFMMVESGSALAASVVLSGVSNNACSYTGFNVDANGNLLVTCADTTGSTPTQPPSCTLTASPSTINQGSSTYLTANCSPAATSFSWTGINFTGSGGSVNPTSTTSYSVSGTNSVGTGNTSAVVVTVTANDGGGGGGGGGVGQRTVPPTSQSPLSDIRLWNAAFETRNNLPVNRKNEPIGWMSYLKRIKADKPNQFFMPTW